MNMFDNRRYARHLCECGLCDEWAKLGDRFVYNHHRRGKHVSKETLERMRKAHKGKPNRREGTHHSEATKEKMSKAQMGKVLSEETIRKIKYARRNQAPPMLNKHHSVKTKRKMGKSRLGKSLSELGHKSNCSCCMCKAKRHEKRGPCPKETRKKISESNMGKHCSSESKRRNKRAHIRLWKNSEYRERNLKAIFAGLNIKPNKPEKILDKILQNLFPNNWKYVGDGSILIGFKNPDFININGQKKVIELFGDYWHSKKCTGISKKKHSQERVKCFAKYGYKTLIIWEHELANTVRLKEKIFEYMDEV